MSCRHICAALLSPLVLPLSYVGVLWVYVGGDPFEAAPLLPGHLAVILIYVYMVMFIVALPLWLKLNARYSITFPAAGVAGAGIGIVVAITFRALNSQLNYPFGFLELTGGIGSAVCALIFRAIVGRQSKQPH
jgi:hypothetical protein